MQKNRRKKCNGILTNTESGFGYQVYESPPKVIASFEKFE